MKCTCRRCRTVKSIFWWAFAVGAPAGSTVEEDQIFYLCDNCVHELVMFMDIDLYRLKRAIE